MTFTFLIKSQYLDAKFLTTILKNLGWQEADLTNTQNTNKIIDFIYVDGLFRHTLQPYKNLSLGKANLKCFINAQNNLIDKSKLYQFANSKLPGVFPKSYIDIMNKPAKVPFHKKSKYIIRPVQGYSGKGLIIVKTKKDLTKNLTDIRNGVNLPFPYEGEIVISEYIQNLMLFQNKIFHLRVYLIVGCINNKLVSFMANCVRIMTAKSTFNIENELNKDVYDSHLATTDNDYFLPDDLNLSNEQTAKIINQIINCLSVISKLAKNEIKCYSESKNCFEILGADLMLTNNYQIKLLEINNRTMVAAITKQFKPKLTKILMEDMIGQFIYPIFYPDKPVPKLKNWILL